MRILINELLLVICSCSDIKTREIDVRVPIICIFMKICVCPRCDVFGIIPGLLIMIVAQLFSEVVGKGDGYVLIVLGLFEDIEFIISVIFISSIFVFVFVVLILIISFMRCKKLLCNDLTECGIPFIPFIFLGYNAMSVIKIL